MSKSRKVLNEVGDQISSFAREAILSIDRLEKELAELKASSKKEEPKKAEAKIEPKPEVEHKIQNEGNEGSEEQE